MKVLITGGFGFVGGRLAKQLDAEGYEIVLGSRYCRQSPEWCSKAVVATINWSDKLSLLKACRGIDFIIHAAGLNALDCMGDPAAAVEANALTTINLIQSSIKNKVKKFIYLSTAHVYDSPLQGVITENRCARNLHPYATSHKAGEDSVLFSHSQGSIEGIVFRLSNSFGAPVHIESTAWTLLVNDICRQAIINETIILKSNGRQYRDFISLETATKTIGKSLHTSFLNEHNTIYNLGSGVSMSISAMAQLVSSRFETLYGKAIPVVNPAGKSTKPDQPLNYSIEKLKKKLLFFQSDLNNEIDNLLIFCKNNFGKK